MTTTPADRETAGEKDATGITTMSAIVQHRYGGSETFEVARLPRPAPGPGEVLVRVRAAAVDRGTWHLMTGLPLVARPAIGLRTPRTPIPGRDVAGTVVSVGAGVTGFAAGDEVVGTADGSLAEFAPVPVTRLAHAPASATPEQAAAVPISGLTALQAVRAARIADGDRVLITGASGGVGSYAVQIATAAGARVTAVASGAKEDFVRSLGATEFIDYTAGPIDRSGTRFDAIIDIAGNLPVRRLRRMLTARGTLVVVGSETGGRWTAGVQRQLYATLVSPFVRQRLTGLVSKETGQDMTELVAMVDDARIRPAVDKAFSLDDAASAMDYLLSGQVRGKVAVSLAP
ncbi:NADPH:quinone reductase-like Zn-dependent oxidoreductase [Gordonia amarae]|nr:NAD(P)-dependent alcohol dehydrogenase [Gordonia amarae]MCS3876674.1 NADPH:quinone reductase-like Zn-dependent oxidoreductase [Gordonia amarae]GAB03923.1 putative oxidoreductase [Gordonia amarae NBRC 15530]